MKRPFVCGNWKMNCDEGETALLLDALRPLLAPALAPPGAVEIAVAPPSTSLRTAGERLAGAPISLAAQNLHWATHGAFTGEISAAMLVALGVRYVIVGHSERRRLFRETDKEIGRKAAAAAGAGMVPILCVGELESERQEGRTMAVVEAQLEAGLERLPAIGGETLVVAYEPVWAIGTGRTASPAQASEVHGAIREMLVRRAGSAPAAAIRVVYGGSVTADTAPALFHAPDIDGALVGGASLVPASFAAIVASAAGSRGSQRSKP